SGNSSTFAFFCPRLKMRILASKKGLGKCAGGITDGCWVSRAKLVQQLFHYLPGTPRQKWDFGYGLFLQYQ
ncbi:hypothetical protein P7K49_039916, partial [Saguinus oedipus]